VTDEKKQKRNK